MKTSLKIFFVLTLLMVVTIFSQDKPKFEQPILISSAGQSADVKLAELLFKRGQIEETTINMAKPADLEGVKTLVIVPGFSSKGLGAAGISADDEMNRVKSLIKSANEKEIPIVVLHIGGSARRKGQSDVFITEAANSAKYMIVVEQGNDDGFFSKISEEKNIPLILVEKIPDAAAPIKEIF